MLLKRITYLLLLLGIFLLISAGDGRIVKTTTKYKEWTHEDSSRIDTVIKKAYSVMGTPYKWAGANPKTGFDCSGFVYWCYQHIGIATARSSSGLWNMGEKVEMEEAMPGDLILFKGTNANSKGVGHVGIVTSKKGEPLKFVHSSSSKQHWGVIETVYGQSYYTKRYLGIRRVIHLGK